ncbi:MAG: hypothetical protein ACREB8_01075 [Pseudolabrys sp.]
MDTLRQRRPRVQDAAHLAWIRTLPCLVTGRREGIEAAHVRYSDPRFAKRQAGIGEKPDDRWTVPLHHETHRTGPEAQHNSNERAWWVARGIDPVMVAAALYANSGDDDAAHQILLTARANAA